MDSREFLEMMAGGPLRQESPRILPEAAIERLKEAAVLYCAENPYKAGDIVTPRKGSPIKGRGIPHLVLEVSEGFPIQSQTAGSWVTATAFTLKVVTIDEGAIVPHLVPHWMMEPFRLD